MAQLLVLYLTIRNPYQICIPCSEYIKNNDARQKNYISFLINHPHYVMLELSV